MRYRPTRHALVKPLDDGAMALNVATGEYYSLNETAARMWLLLEEGCSANEIVATIVSEYAAATEQVERDLTQLICELKRINLIFAA